jgi:hypothetical protein
MATIFTPFFVAIFEKDKAVSKSEKRHLAPLPTIELRGGQIKRFPDDFTDYFADHFGGREWLSSTYRKLKHYIGDSPSQDVTLGKEGWLFLGSVKSGYSRYNDPIGDARNANLYSMKELARVADYMMTIKAWLKKKNIEYMFVITPNKHTIYAEKLPDYIQKINPYSSTDQLTEYLNKHTNIKVVDLRQPLLDKKADHLLYKKTGTHWNHYAVNIAQYEIMKAIEQFFPEAVDPQLFKLKDGIKNNGGDLAGMIGNRNFRELAPRPIFKETCKPVKIPKHALETDIFSITCDGPKLSALIFRDSFFNDLRLYLARQLYHTTYIWGALDFPLLQQQLEEHIPDIVIEEMVERKLPYHPKAIPQLGH